MTRTAQMHIELEKTGPVDVYRIYITDENGYRKEPLISGILKQGEQPNLDFL